MAATQAGRTFGKVARSSFWHTDNGKTVTRLVGLILPSGIAGGYILMNAAFNDDYRDLVAHYENGFPVKISEKLNQLRVEVIEDLKIKEKYVKAITLFHNYGFEPFTVGALTFINGVFIGLPKYFAYENIKDIETTKIKLEDKPVSWDTESGDLFRESLILSDNAKKFIIAQQITKTNTYYPIFQSVFVAGPSLLYQAVTITANEKLHGFLRSASFRLCLYGVTGAFCYGIYMMCSDMYRKYLERLGDDTASSLGVDYARGGVEYYVKSIQQNIAIRDLLGPAGESNFTQLGNYKELFRQKTTPLTKRKENAEKNMAKYFSEDSTNVVDDNKNLE